MRAIPILILLAGCTGMQVGGAPEPIKVSVNVVCPPIAPASFCQSPDRPPPETLRRALIEREQLLLERGCWEDEAATWAANHADCLELSE